MHRDPPAEHRAMVVLPAEVLHSIGRLLKENWVIVDGVRLENVNGAGGKELGHPMKAGKIVDNFCKITLCSLFTNG
jgi:hypothetical protein